MTRKGNQRFYYNYRNQLVRISEGEMEIAYKYDALGRRIERTKGTNTISYYYCDNQVIEERNGADQVMKQYVYGNGIDEAIQLKIVNGANAGDYYYHANGIGSTTAITDGNGVLIERVKYDVYGVPLFTDAAGQPLAGNQSAIGNRVLFQGREYDQDAGIYYFRARYYDPTMGRFMQTDPLGYHDSRNLYQAFNLNPANFVDPMGKYFIIPYDTPNRSQILTALALGAMTSLGGELFWNIFNDPRMVVVQSGDLKNIRVSNNKFRPECGKITHFKTLCNKIASVEATIDFSHIKKYWKWSQDLPQGQGRLDPLGVTSIYHELYHAAAYLLSSPFVVDSIIFTEANILAGKQDKPESATGAAQQFGESIFSQLPFSSINVLSMMDIINAIEQKQKEIWDLFINNCF